MGSKAYVHKQLRHLVHISNDVIEDENLEMVDSLPPDGDYKYVEGDWNFNHKLP